MKMNQFVRVCLEIFAGIIVSVALCSLLIFLGYYHVHSVDADQYTVKFLGVKIYEIVRQGSDYTGTALNQNMSMLGICCSLVLIIVSETIIFVKQKKNK